MNCRYCIVTVCRRRGASVHVGSNCHFEVTDEPLALALRRPPLKVTSFGTFDMTTPEQRLANRPRVGVGCIVVRENKMLMVKTRRGGWSTPGGHLEFGESPSECAVRESKEEAGVTLSNVEFVAVTNDVFSDTGPHYVTIWMRAEADSFDTSISDTEEVVEAAWFAPDALPSPLFLYLENLMAGRSLPPRPQNLPFAGVWR